MIPLAAVLRPDPNEAESWVLRLDPLVRGESGWGEGEPGTGGQKGQGLG